MSKERDMLWELLGNDLAKIDKDRIMSRVEHTYGMRIAELQYEVNKLNQVIACLRI